MLSGLQGCDTVLVATHVSEDYTASIFRVTGSGTFCNKHEDRHIGKGRELGPPCTECHNLNNY